MSRTKSRVEERAEITTNTNGQIVIAVAVRDADGRLRRRTRTLRHSRKRGAFAAATKLRNDLVRELRERQRQPQPAVEQAPTLDEVIEVLTGAMQAARCAMKAAQARRPPHWPATACAVGQVHLDVALRGTSQLCRRLKAAAEQVEGVRFARVWNRSGLYRLDFDQIRYWVPSGMEIGIQEEALLAAGAVLRDRLGAEPFIDIWET